MELYTRGSFTKPPFIGILYSGKEIDNAKKDNEDFFNFYHSQKDLIPRVTIRLELFANFCHLKLDLKTATDYKFRFYRHLNYDPYGLEKWFNIHKDKSIFRFAHIAGQGDNFKVFKTRGDYSSLIEVQSVGLIECAVLLHTNDKLRASPAK